MDYAALSFASFLAITLGFYLVLPHRAQNLWLLGASLYFYFAICDAGDFAWCLLISIATEFVSAQRIAAATDRRERRRWLAFSLVVELSILGYFKLNGFFVTTFVPFLERHGLYVPWHVEWIALPLAISFYTFQCLGYTLDVYRGQQKPETDFVDFALFNVLFFQLIAGPIERARRLLPQVKAPRAPSVDGFLQGCFLLFVGIYKKVAVADQLYPVARQLAPLTTLPVNSVYDGIDVLLGTTLAAFAMYAEFSGYTEAMRGLARMFGFEISVNFKAPFLARNIQEYWARWHISLTSWIRDYLYLPMVLNRFWKRLGSGGLAIVTMLIMGLWHGAKTTFLLWGLWHGCLLALYGRLRPWLYAKTQFRTAFARHAWTAACVLTTFACAVVGGVMFNAPDLVTIKRELRDIVFRPYASPGAFLAFGLCLLRYLPVLVLDWMEHKSTTPDAFLRAPYAVRTALQLVMLGLVTEALLRGQALPPFQYF